MFAQEICLVLAILITLAGVWMHWHMHHYHMGAEEAMKERKLSAEQVDRRLKVMRTSAGALTIIGMSLLIVAVTVLAD
jgi:hypothetical protein